MRTFVPIICLLITAVACVEKSNKVTVEGCGEEKTLVVDDAYNQKYGLDPLNFTLSYYSDVPHELPEEGKGYGTYAKFAKRDGEKIVEQVRLNSWSATGMNADNKEKMMKDILSNSTSVLEFNYKIEDIQESKQSIAGKEFWVADATAMEKSDAESGNPSKYLMRVTIMAPSDTASRGLSVVQIAGPDSNIKTYDDFYSKACTALVVSSIDFTLQ